MYCPNCGTQNLESINFCRSCGLDLSTIARVMEKHLPYTILEKIDEKVLNPQKNNLYASIINVLLSSALLIVALYLSNWGYPRDALYFYISSFFGFLGTIWYFLIYVRSRSKTKIVLTTSDYIELNRLSDENDREEIEKQMPAKDIAKLDAPASGITEATTNLLYSKRYKTKSLHKDE